MRLIECALFLLLLLTGVPCEPTRNYRFDYEWNDEAVGWLKYHNSPTTWDKARLKCQAEGAVLASPLTEQLKQAIVAYAQKKETSENKIFNIFSGVHSIFSDGDYSSIEGVPLLRLAVTWEEGEPDNFQNLERCLEMNVGYNGTMADTRCDNTLPYVCYKKNTTLIFTDCGTTDPEYVLDSRTGSCYKFHRTGLQWQDAYATCTSEGGYLAIINNDVEAEVIRDIFKRDSHKKINAQFNKSVFVGFHDWSSYGTNFRTIHGEPLEDNYHIWAPGQPDNNTRYLGADLGEYCGSVTRAKVQLNDSCCQSRLTFLCEKETNSLFKK